jgi:cell division protein FtsW (lipid II flippase)
MTVLCILVLSLLDDSLILMLQASPERKEVDERHRSAHFTIITTVIFVFVFFFFTSFPYPDPDDSFNGQLISILFYIFLVAIIAASATINDLSDPRMDSILWIKEGIEVFFRIVVFFWLVSVYNMHYTRD